MSFTNSSIPREQISKFILIALSQNGKTIKMLEAQGRRYEGDESQKKYYEKPVWHSKKDLDEFVARKLKLGSSVWGPERTSNDFITSTAQEIAKFRKKGDVVDWNKSRRFNIVRLAKTPDQPIGDLEMSVEGEIPAWNSSSPPAISEDDLKRTFMKIMISRKDNTYKFALARALLDHCNKDDAKIPRTYDISYGQLSSKFLKYYWHQVCKFQIKQDFHTKRTPMVVQAIKSVFDKKTVGYFDKLNQDHIQKAEEKILKTVFGSAKSKKGVVVSKFQKIMNGRTAEERKIFYTYDDVEQKIVLRPQAFEFFQKYHTMLSRVVILEWTKYLERANTLLPSLASKIGEDKAKRRSLIAFRNEYLKHTDCCFYCCNKLEPGCIDVDHFIPWSYMFDDNPWNLVLACRECNSRKSDSLAGEKCKSDLIKRNKDHIDKNKDHIDKNDKLKESLDLLNTGNGWEVEIKRHYNNCKKHGFNTIKLPRCRKEKNSKTAIKATVLY